VRIPIGATAIGSLASAAAWSDGRRRPSVGGETALADAGGRPHVGAAVRGRPPAPGRRRLRAQAVAAAQWSWRSRSRHWLTHGGTRWSGRAPTSSRNWSWRRGV